jgi:copper chaperone CopZ
MVAAEEMEEEEGSMQGELMKVGAAYLSVIEGRFRLKVPAVKGAPHEAVRLEAQLELVEGVDEVTANPVTGSVLVHYDPRRTSTEAVTEALRGWGYLGDVVPSDVAGPGSHGFGSLMLRATTEFALQQLLTALI